MLTVLCLQLAARYDLEVICDGQGDMPARLEKEGVKVHSLPLTSKWSFTASLPRLAAAVRGARPDVVHLHGQFAGSLGQIALSLAGRPNTLYTAQWPSYLDDGGTWSRLRNKTAEQVSCAGARLVVVLSENDRKEFTRRGLCDPRKLLVIPNAYFIDSDPATPRRMDRQLIGFVGRLVDQKGCEFLVRAAPHVLAEMPSARVVIVGDGPERPNLERLARELGVASAVEFGGYDPHPARRMREMAVLAVPSIYEPLGMVALEAMACEVPVVASAVGGLPEVVEGGTTGLLVPPRDPDALAAALLRILKAPDQAASMGAAGLARARAGFSPEVISNRYAEVYNRLAATASS
jgi:glycosyltransferase involved in cell wall biosynthesis